MIEDTTTWHKIYLGLGSNLGDRRAILAEGMARLKAGGQIKVQAISRLYQTAPVGYADQPAFLNMAVEAVTSFEPAMLLSFIKQIEVELGREPTFPNGPRSLDIDILFYEALVLVEPHLVIPHPRLAVRGFVLAPLAELAPYVIHPLLSRSIEALLEACNPQENGLPPGVELYTAEPPLTLPLPRLLFVTGRLAAVWLENFVREVATRLAFEPEVLALELDVAAFMTARYVVDKLRLEADAWEKLDALILPGFIGGDIKQVETFTKIRAWRGPTDLLEVEPFLAALLGQFRPTNVTKPDAAYYTESDLRQMQARLTESNIRIYTDGERVYAFNQTVFGAAVPEERELRRLYRLLNISDPAHSYYLGRELYKAALSVKIGLRYHQDRELEFPNPPLENA